MNSIYEQLNKINDNESLSEKYNVKNAKELKNLNESSVSSRYTDDVWTISFKDDPDHVLFKGDKDECDSFVKTRSSDAAAKVHGGLVVKQGATVPVITDSFDDINEAFMSDRIQAYNDTSDFISSFRQKYHYTNREILDIFEYILNRSNHVLVN